MAQEDDHPLQLRDLDHHEAHPDAPKVDEQRQGRARRRPPAGQDERAGNAGQGERDDQEQELAEDEHRIGIEVLLGPPALGEGVPEPQHVEEEWAII